MTVTPVPIRLLLLLFLFGKGPILFVIVLKIPAIGMVFAVIPIVVVLMGTVIDPVVAVFV
jgi:hypothetical protein